MRLTVLFFPLVLSGCFAHYDTVNGFDYGPRPGGPRISAMNQVVYEGGDTCYVAARGIRVLAQDVPCPNKLALDEAIELGVRDGSLLASDLQGVSVIVTDLHFGCGERALAGACTNGYVIVTHPEGVTRAVRGKLPRILEARLLGER